MIGETEQRWRKNPMNPESEKIITIPVIIRWFVTSPLIVLFAYHWPTKTMLLMGMIIGLFFTELHWYLWQRAKRGEPRI